MITPGSATPRGPCSKPTASTWSVRARPAPRAWRPSRGCARRSSCSTSACPDLDGIEVAGRLKACPGGGPAVVLTSSRDASDYPPHFEHCGARGFIAKAELSGDALAMLAA